MAMKDEAYYQGLLARSFDEELVGEDRADLEQALRTSFELRQQADQYRKLREAFRSVPAPESSAFTDAVMQSVKQAAADRLPVRWLYWAAAASVAVILLAGVSVYWSAGSFSPDALVGVSELAPEDAVTLLQAY
jgi:hypothetical protein